MATEQPQRDETPGEQTAEQTSSESSGSRRFSRTRFVVRLLIRTVLATGIGVTFVNVLAGARPAGVEPGVMAFAVVLFTLFAYFGLRRLGV
jgi:hypothetical protein